MTVLDRYLWRAVVSGTLLVLTVLLALAAFINFVGQLERVGTGRYHLPQALAYVLASLPRNAHKMLPIAVLVGALHGLGALAAKSELLVMRVAGMSVPRLAVAVLGAAFGLMLLGVALGEWVAPPAQRYATRLRTFSLNEQLSEAGGSSAWVKDGPQIVSLESSADTALGEVYVFTLDDRHRLASVSRALSGGFGAGETWTLYDVRESRFTDAGVVATRVARAQRETSLRSELVELSIVDPDDLGSRALWSYSGYLRAQGLDAYAYELAFWSRIANHVSVLLMAALALPFVFGSQRSAGAGQRLMIGVLLGVIYYVGAETMASSGAVFDLPPALVGWLPVTVLAVVVGVALARVR
jgi:lipopolysaccharide export system permease protein